MGPISLMQLEEEQPTLWPGLCYLLSGWPRPQCSPADLCAWALGDGPHPAPPTALITQAPQGRVLRALLRPAAPVAIVATQQAGSEAAVPRAEQEGRGQQATPPPPAPLRRAPPALRAPLPAAHPARCRRSAPPAPERSGLGAGPSGEGRAGAEPPPRRARGGPPPLFLFLPSSLSPVSRLLAPLLFCALPARAPARPAHR